MKRYGSSNNLVDNFSYTYYSGTNRLKNIGSGNDYTYDANGNVITDDLNKNTDFKYDWRNLMTENKNVLSLNTFWTLYKYDEAGNRINKKQYMYVLGPPPGGIETGIGGGGDSIIVDEGDGSGYWAMAVNIFYVRDAGGKEIAVYNSNNIEQWNIYGLDNVGKIDANNKRYYYLKDHLGSIRAVLDTTNTVVSANDYDCWGYLMENRTYENTAMRYKFTGKEKDKDLENNYDYFGARYYDSRIGRWGGVEPLLEKYISFSPYCYSICNPINFFDIDGKKLFIGGETELSVQYLRSMLPENEQYRIDYNHQTNEVSFDANSLDIMSDNAYLLVSNLVNSENNYLFEVADNTTGITRHTTEENSAGDEISLDLTSGKGYENMSITPHGYDENKNPIGLMPKGGYEGQVSLGKGDWTFGWGNNDYQPKSNMVFHELWENYNRTQYGAQYTVAHNAANLMAKNYKKQVGEPGKAGEYKYNK